MEENAFENILKAVELKIENATYSVDDSDLWNCGAIVKEGLPYD